MRNAAVTGVLLAALMFVSIMLPEPAYAGAKSFANGYAAVCNADGLWGVINSRYELVIDYAYLSVSYFSSAETSWVSTFEGTVQLMKFMFE